MIKKVKNNRVRKLSWHGSVFKEIEGIWQNFREFFHRNDSFFEFLFLLLYFFEQAGLVYFTIVFRKEVDKLPYVVAFFALALLTTVALHRLVMESKNKFVKETHNEFVLAHHNLEAHYALLENEYKQQNRLLKNVLEENERLFKQNQKLKNIITEKKIKTFL